MGGVNIDITTLQRETYFLKEFSDVWSVLQGVFAITGFWPKSVQSGVYTRGTCAQAQIRMIAA